MQFNVGDKAVYPAHGVGIIRDVITMELDGEKHTFYVLKIMDNGMTIRVPIDNARQIGMRTVLGQEHIDKVFEILKEVNRTDRVSVLLVEQNAALALEFADHAYLIETGRIVMSGTTAAIGADENIRRAYLGY